MHPSATLALRDSLAVLSQAADRTENVAATMHRLGRVAQSRLYALRAAYLREWLAFVEASLQPDRGQLHSPPPDVPEHGLRLDGALTLRERQVAALVVQGLTNREIADRLVITPGTVANHVAHILNKLDCRNRAQLISTILGRAVDGVDHVQDGRAARPGSLTSQPDYEPVRKSRLYENQNL